jgi:hypothetical protein
MLVRGVEDAGSVRSGGRGSSRVTHMDGNSIINGLGVALIKFVLFCVFLVEAVVFGIHLPEFLVGTCAQSFVASSNAMLVKLTGGSDDTKCHKLLVFDGELRIEKVEGEDGSGDRWTIGEPSLVDLLAFFIIGSLTPGGKTMGCVVAAVEHVTEIVEAERFSEWKDLTIPDLLVIHDVIAKLECMNAEFGVINAEDICRCVDLVKAFECSQTSSGVRCGV